MAIRLECSTLAKCRPEQAWEKLKNVHAWPWWNQAIGQVRWIQGEAWQQGSRLEIQVIRPRKMKIQPMIVECSPPTSVHWSGRKIGARGEQWFYFEVQPDGTTLLKTVQILSGLRTLFITNAMRRDGERTLRLWLEALKVEAEKLAREEAARS